MKQLLVILAIFFSVNNILAQEIPIPEKHKTIPNSKSYWSYSVARKNTKRDSLHNYIIRVNIAQVDSTGNTKGFLKIKDAIIYCRFSENGTERKIKFKNASKYWKAKFRIHSNQILPLEIVAKYKDHETVMNLNLNTGIYPGEDD